MGQVINNLTHDLDVYKKEIIKRLANIVVDTAKEIELEATRKTPTDKDGHHFINIDTKVSDKGLTAEVGVMGGRSDVLPTDAVYDKKGRVILTENQESHMAAYLEFGTGLNFFEVTAGYPDWVIEIAKPFIKNKRGTLKGKPYFYPTVLKHMPLFRKKVKILTDTNFGDE